MPLLLHVTKKPVTSFCTTNSVVYLWGPCAWPLLKSAEKISMKNDKFTFKSYVQWVDTNEQWDLYCRMAQAFFCTILRTPHCMPLWQFIMRCRQWSYVMFVSKCHMCTFPFNCFNVSAFNWMHSSGTFLEHNSIFNVDTSCDTGRHSKVNYLCRPLLTSFK